MMGAYVATGIKARIAELAQRQGRTVSDVLRDAAREYLARHERVETNEHHTARPDRAAA